MSHYIKEVKSIPHPFAPPAGLRTLNNGFHASPSVNSGSKVQSFATAHVHNTFSDGQVAGRLKGQTLTAQRRMSIVSNKYPQVTDTTKRNAENHMNAPPLLLSTVHPYISILVGFFKWMAISTMES